MSAGHNVEEWGPVHAVPTCHRAVTTVGGNADVTRCTGSALRLLHVFGRDDVGIMIDRARFTRLLVDAFGRLP